MTPPLPARFAVPAAAILPGLALAGLVALAAALAEPAVALVTGNRTIFSAIVLALVLGMALSGGASVPAFQPGLGFAVRHVLRWAIALLGLRVAFSDIVALGATTILLVLVAMAATIYASVRLAESLGLGTGFGALAGAANAVCGASAALATATVLPPHPQRTADLAFTVAAANGVSTLVMLLYPWAGVGIGLSPQENGIMLGATIHDMAQVVGAGYGMGDAVGNGAVVVKLFRVFLLLPVVLCIGWWLRARAAGEAGDRTPSPRVPVPIFAFVFLLMVALNSLAPSVPGLAEAYAAVKPWLVQASSVGLLLAIAALGLGTSLRTLAGIGWRHLAVFLAATGLIFGVTVAGLLVMRLAA